MSKRVGVTKRSSLITFHRYFMNPIRTFYCHFILSADSHDFQSMKLLYIIKDFRILLKSVEFHLGSTQRKRHWSKKLEGPINSIAKSRFSNEPFSNITKEPYFFLLLQDGIPSIVWSNRRKISLRKDDIFPRKIKPVEVTFILFWPPVRHMDSSSYHQMTERCLAEGRIEREWGPS